jgi:hypothetical protein
LAKIEITMKAICVTGNSQSHIEATSIYLMGAGVLPALPSKRDHEITTGVWHEMVLEPHQPLVKIQAIGNLWEKMAIDIFLANHKQRLWHWAEKSSLQLADYWLNFDAGIHFLLVETSLDDYLEAQFNSAKTASELDVEKEVADWDFHTRTLKDLHAAFPHRTTLVTTERLVNDSDSVIQQLNQVMDVGLQPTATYRLGQSSDPVLRYLLKNVIAERAPSFSRTVKSAKPKTENKITTLALDVVSFYLTKKASADIPASSNLPGQLLTSTHPVIEGELSELREKIAELESDNKFLLHQLHETQEEYEQHLRTVQPIYSELGIAKARLEKALLAHPDYWENDDFEIIPLKRPNAFKWSIKNTYLRNFKIPTLEFETIITDKGVTLSILRSADAAPAFVKWPGEKVEKLDLSTIDAGHGQGNILNWLGPTDWDNVAFLANRICAFCTSDKAINHLSAAASQNISKGMNFFVEVLEKWPAVLRYDTADLSEVIQVGEYHALGIRLTNVRIGSLEWSSFEYRIATFNDAGSGFGAHPRLEFPETSRHAVQSWYPETTDDRGERLELRFSQPDAMDTMVWSRLAGNDQLLITALLVSIPTQLSDLQRSNSKSGVRWDNWQTVALFMRKTLASMYNSKPQLIQPVKDATSTKRVKP